MICQPITSWYKSSALINSGSGSRVDLHCITPKTMAHFTIEHLILERYTWNPRFHNSIKWEGRYGTAYPLWYHHRSMVACLFFFFFLEVLMSPLRTILLHLVVI